MAVPEGNGPIPQNAYVMVHGITLKNFRRVMSEVWDSNTDKLMEDLRRKADQCLARLEQDAWQPRLAMEADGPATTKTRERRYGSTSDVWGSLFCEPG